MSYFWNIVFLLAIGTVSIRGSIIALSERIKISDRMRDLFSYIPASILPALIAPAVFFHHGRVAVLLGKERLLILVLATVLCYYSRNTLITIVFGLGALYLVGILL